VLGPPLTVIITLVVAMVRVVVSTLLVVFVGTLPVAVAAARLYRVCGSWRFFFRPLLLDQTRRFQS
jgi:hypothetical protein